MTRKTTNEAGTTVEAEPRLKPVRLGLPEDAHQLLRMLAASEGISMAAFARDAFEPFVRAEAKRRKIRV